MRWWCWAVATLLLSLSVTYASPAGAENELITYRYDIKVKGTIRSDINEFASNASATLNDPKGWSLGGSVRFAQVDSGSDFTLWLSEASQVPSFSPDCSSTYSCRVGRDVIINDDRWAGGSPYLAMPVPSYRHMVVNHEVGHWLGFGHRTCAGAGQPAYLMQQQSKGGDFLGACLPNPWPRREERRALGSRLGVPVIEVPRRLEMAVTPSGNGYWVAQADGYVFARGDAGDFGSMVGRPLNFPLVGMAARPTGLGYWLCATDGGIFAFGDAPFYGSTGNIRLNKPIVAMSSTPSGLGYWFVATDGGIFNYGDARFFGSTGSIKLNNPIVGMEATPSGNGYWLVATDGGIFAYGDAPFHGSTGNIDLNKPIVAMTATATGAGYWFVASDGGIFAYGDAPFYGSKGGDPLPFPIVGLTATPSGRGYWLLAADGIVYPFGDAGFYGHAQV